MHISVNIIQVSIKYKMRQYQSNENEHKQCKLKHAHKIFATVNRNCGIDYDKIFIIIQFLLIKNRTHYFTIII